MGFTVEKKVDEGEKLTTRGRQLKRWDRTEGMKREEGEEEERRRTGRGDLENDHMVHPDGTTIFG